MKRTLLTLLTLAAAVSPVAAIAQETTQASPQLVDRIIAVVDEEAILLSDLEREIESYRFEMQSAGRDVDVNDAEVRQRLLDQLIEVKLLVAQAKLDGLVIGDDELDAETAKALQRLIDRFGTRKALERELEANGMTFEDLEASNREVVRNRLYTMRMIQTHIRPRIEIDEAEIEAFYEEHKDELPSKPTVVQLANILVVPQPEQAELDALNAKLDSIRVAFDRGMSFAEVAKKYSEGPNASRGGRVGRFTRGSLFNPILEKEAWELPEGEISPPITTELGIHLIKVENRTEDALELHQILLRLEVSDENRRAARERAEEVARLARAGQDWSELVKTYSNDPTGRERDGILDPVPVDRLSPLFRRAIEDLEPGGVSDPVEGSAGYFVVKLLKRDEGAPYAYEEVEDRLRAMVLDQKIEEELGKFTDELRERFYVDIRN